MAFRLSDLIIAGFFMNPRRFSTHGRLLLRGAETPVAFELTGAPCPVLCGRTLEFEVPENDRDASDKDRRLAAEFKPYQIGVTGKMTAERKVRTFDCSIEDVCSDSEGSGAFRPLIGTGWVQNFCTSDYRKRCREADPLPE